MEIKLEQARLAAIKGTEEDLVKMEEKLAKYKTENNEFMIDIAEKTAERYRSLIKSLNITKFDENNNLVPLWHRIIDYPKAV